MCRVWMVWDGWREGPGCSVWGSVGMGEIDMRGICCWMGEMGDGRWAKGDGDLGRDGGMTGHSMAVWLDVLCTYLLYV